MNESFYSYYSYIHLYHLGAERKSRYSAMIYILFYHSNNEVVDLDNVGLYRISGNRIISVRITPETGYPSIWYPVDEKAGVPAT